MFTDIEGSTALRTTLGDAETDALFRQHDELIRERIAAHKGHDQQAALGDGFLAVFVSTRRAVACAIDIQRGFDTFNRARSGPALNVRIGLNTGEVAWQDGQLSGEAVHAAARVCAAGSGGQILVSDVTRQLTGTLPDVTFRDAGEFQLKGFPQPWRLYDVVWVRETTAVAQQVFVGRDAELARLRARLVSAIDGGGGLVLVGGEPGVGKTTLVRQLIREAEQRGALAVFGRCYESEGTIPYSPFVEMLEQALAVMPPDIVREDMGDDAPEVARMVPALRRQFPDIGEPLELPPEQQRRYFFNAVAAFIARGSTRFPLVLVMDDVHWADEPTLLLIEHMAAVMPELRVLGVGTYRDVELDVSRPLAVALERMMRARLVERVPVRRFDRDTVATMIQAMAGKPPPDVVVEAIFDETEGNPFFIEEVFRHLVEDGKLLTDEVEFRADLHVDELDVPESVRLVVGRRLERLGPEAQRALAAGAVVGRAFPFGLLEEIVDLDTGTLLDIVETAEAARVIVAEERDGEVHYSFGHELIRQTLLSGLSVLRRQRLHLAVADAIERTDKRARRDRPSEIAQHLLQAGAAAGTSAPSSTSTSRRSAPSTPPPSKRPCGPSTTPSPSSIPTRPSPEPGCRSGGGGPCAPSTDSTSASPTGSRCSTSTPPTAWPRRPPPCAARSVTTWCGSTASRRPSPSMPAGWISSATNARRCAPSSWPDRAGSSRWPASTSRARPSWRRRRRSPGSWATAGPSARRCGFAPCRTGATAAPSRRWRRAGPPSSTCGRPTSNGTWPTRSDGRRTRSS
jgi:hypothetical protein